MAARPNWDVRWTSRFESAYGKLDARAQVQVEKAVHKMERLHRADSRSWAREYERVAGVPARPILEDRLHGALRLLVEWSPPMLVLADVGKKRIVPHFGRRASRSREILSIPEAPLRFHLAEPSPLVAHRMGNAWDQFPEEMRREWAFFLDEPQSKILLKAEELILTNLQSLGPPQVIAVVGGPGTGKTCVLFRVLKDFTEHRVNSDVEYDLHFAASRRMREYLASTGFTLDWCAHEPRGSKPRIVLLDDPTTLSNVKDAQFNAPDGSTIVCGFDPLQLADMVTDQQLTRFWASTKAKCYHLVYGYRQKAYLLEAARDYWDRIAKMNKYINDPNQKRHFANQFRVVNRIGNDVRPRNLSEGYSNQLSGFSDLSMEVETVLSRGRLWTHWPPVLLVVESGVRLPSGFRSWLDRRAGSFHECSLDGVEVEVKGVEYQHVILILAKTTFEIISKSKSGYVTPNEPIYRHARIPLSRAKDSMLVVVAD